MSAKILKQQAKLRELLYVRPFNLCKIEEEAMKLCDMTVDLFEEKDELKEKFEDFYSQQEFEHLKNGTEFTDDEIFNFFKPYLKH